MKNFRKSFEIKKKKKKRKRREKKSEVKLSINLLSQIWHTIKESSIIVEQFYQNF